MLYIDDQLAHAKQAKEKHTKLITCYIKRKILGKSAKTICTDALCSICGSNIRKAITSKYLFSILKNIDIQKLVQSKPSGLVELSREFNKSYLRSRKAITANDLVSLEKIFNYTWFIDKKNTAYNAYDLCNNLEIESCIYCNRLYTSTVIVDDDELIIRPTLDHWFTQEKYPLLALSFYNLIPSCSPCNSSVKHSATFNLNKNIHPYIDKNITQDYKLHSKYDNSLNTFKVTVKIRKNSPKKSKILSTLASMKIEEIYGSHQAELADLDILQRKYNDSYLKSLGKLLDKKFTAEEVYRIMFGVEFEDENFYKRPLSKLKKDILTSKKNS